MAYGDLKCRNLIWNSGSGDNTVVLSTLATQSYVTTNFAPKANPTFTGTINGADLILSGNLTVSGTQTIINTNVLQVEDKHIEIGKVSTPSDTTADGGGIILKASSDRTFVWINSTDAWTSSEHIQVASGKTFIGDGSTLTALNASNLASGTVPTARLGSGTAGSSNYLRGDGSWQAIATDKIEEGNTSVETVDTGSDGHVKITNEGTESARFSSGGALLIGTTSGTHRLTVQGGGTEIAKFIGTNSADLRFRNSTSNHLLVYTGTGDSLLLGTNGQNERFRIDNEGKLGIGGANYGTSGQVLTSQGTSGPPSWAAIPPAGNTIDLVADGAIAAGKPVIVTTAGKAQQVQIMGTADGPGGFGNNWNPLSGYGLTSAQNCQDQQYPDYIINGMSNGGADIRFKAYNVYTGSNSGGSLMLGSGSGIGNNSKIGGLIYLEYLDLFLCSDTEGSNQNTGTGNSKMITFSHNGSGSLTLKYVVSSNLTNTKIHDIVYAKQSSTVDTYFSVIDQSGGLKILGLSSVYSNGNVQPGTDTLVVTTDACIMARMKFNSDKSKFIVLYQKWNNRKLYARGGTWDGTNGASSGITLGSEFTVINAALDSQPFRWQCGVDLACDTGSNRWVAAYEYGSQSKAKCLTLSGTTVSAGSEITVDSTDPDGEFRIINNHSVPNCVTWAGLYQHGMGAVNIIISGTNTLTLSGSVRQAYGYGPDGNCNVGMASGVVKNSNVSMAEAAYLLWRRNGSEPRSMRIDTASSASNATASNVIGFAENAINDTATGTIKLTGNVVGNQSGLTAGTAYYIQSDGTLGTSQDNTLGAASGRTKAGIALSATTLKISDYV